MSKSVLNYVEQKVEQRKAQGNYRMLFLPEGRVDFFSNDYLGIGKENLLHQCVQQKIENAIHVQSVHGATGSRLLSGNSSYILDLEQRLAQLHQADEALLFNSGYNANIAVLSALPYKNATIIYDEMVHASMLDGIKMSKAQAVSFRHNSIDDLEQKLSHSVGLKFIAIESLYSMEGDFAPLKEIVILAQQFDAAIILDEAHSTGIFGEKGEGWAQHLHLHQNIFVRIHTFGKAPCAHGAVVLCNQSTKEFLVNYARPFIYTTALPLSSIFAIDCSYQFLASKRANSERRKLQEVISFFNDTKDLVTNFRFAHSVSPIQTLFVEGNENAKNVAAFIRKQGFEVRAILSPTVPAGTERIRICLHSFNTFQEVESLFNTIQTVAI
jgi:8-amino-7-oxononanoate synthase